MAWDAKLGWAGEFTGHSIQHDLEAFMWLMWVLCINLDGPFNRGQFKCNDFDKPEHLSSTTKCVRLEDLTTEGGVNSSNSSQKNRAIAIPGAQVPPTSQSVPAPTTVNLTTDKPPTWAHPGLHAQSVSDVAWSRSTILREDICFTDYLSPYFSKHKSVKEGFIKLTKLFVWKPDRNKAADGKAQYLAPKPTTYKDMINIIKEMRDGINPVMDGALSKGEIESARNEFMGLLKKGNLETPVLGKRAGPSQSKKRSLRDVD